MIKVESKIKRIGGQAGAGRRERGRGESGGRVTREGAQAQGPRSWERNIRTGKGKIRL